MQVSDVKSIIKNEMIAAGDAILYSGALPRICCAAKARGVMVRLRSSCLLTHYADALSCPMTTHAPQ